MPALRFCGTRSQARRTPSPPQLPQQKPGGRPREADPSVPCSPDDALPDDKLVSEQSPLENPPVTSTARGHYPKATSWCKAQPGRGLSAKHLPRRANRGCFHAFLPCKSHRDSQGQLEHSSASERPAHTRICLILNKISPRGYLKKNNTDFLSTGLHVMELLGINKKQPPLLARCCAIHLTAVV